MKACPPRNARSCARCCYGSSRPLPTANLSGRVYPHARSVVTPRLFAPPPSGDPVRSRIPTRSLGGDSARARVLGLLVSARLVTTEEDSVELAHEALARAWPRLRSWLDEDAAGQRIFRHLATAADGWESPGHPAEAL